MKKYLLLIATELALLTAQSASAYQVVIPLADRTKTSIQQGFQRGAEQLLLRLTANTTASHTLTADPSQVRKWVDAYATEQNTSNPDNPWELQVTYSTHSIQQLLTKNHLPHWKNESEPISLVLKTTDNQPLPADDPRWIMLRDAALARGYQFNRLEQTPESLPNNLLVAVIADNEINWSWYHDQQWHQWQQPLHEQWSEQTADSIGQTLLQAQPKQSTTDLTPVHLVIHGVRDFKDYAEVLQALHKLPGMRNLTDDGIHDNQLSLTLITDKSVSDIKQALDRIEHLRAKTSKAGSDTDLSYAWHDTATASTDLQKKPVTLSAIDESEPTDDNADHSEPES